MAGGFLNSLVISKTLDDYLPFECHTASLPPLWVTLTWEFRLNNISLDFAACLTRFHFNKLSFDYCRLSYISNQNVFLSEVSSLYVLLYLTIFSQILRVGREEWEDYLAESWLFTWDIPCCLSNKSSITLRCVIPVV